MAGQRGRKPLQWDEAHAALILQELREGKSLRRVAREHHHDTRSIVRLMDERGIPRKGRRRRKLSEEATASTAHLLAHTRVSLSVVAQGLRMGETTLKRQLRAAGIRGHGRRLRPLERQRIDELLAEGATLPAVARAVDRHTRTIERHRQMRARERRAAPQGGPIAAGM